MIYRIFFLILYALAGGLSLQMAFVFRFYFDPLPFRYDAMLWLLLPVAILIKGLAAEGAGLTRAIWSAAGFRDLQRVAVGAVLGSAVFTGAALWLTDQKMPNGALLLDALLTFGLFTGIRFSGRFWSEARNSFAGWRSSVSDRVLVVGSGNRTELALGFLQKRGANVVGILDADPKKRGRHLHGVKILGAPETLGTALMGHPVDEVVLALSGGNPPEVKRVFALASAAGARVSILPDVSPVETPAFESPLREVKMSDFLGRDPVELDPAPLERSLGGKRVLVTGAGGSIGSELCRQISRLPVAQLVMLDFSENALFEISEELKYTVQQDQKEKEAQKGSGLTPFAVLCDIRFPEDLRTVFAEVRPEVVVHAAACKHVPMMESHPLEAARTNVLGTRNVVAAAAAVGVERLMHVSTDKAVNPEGVMGASKAWGERVVREAGYSCVRFGNVLGSSGSVMPLFEKQWSRSGRLQVTHKEATRYFMTIEEAVLLILHAESLGETGETYVLNMGEPLQILELARQLVALKKGDEETTIDITGLRPGERLHEQLHSEAETLQQTKVPKIRRIASSEEKEDEKGELTGELAKLEGLVATRDVDGVRAWLWGCNSTVPVVK